MSLKDERGRGELNVKGEKGIKNTFSTRQKVPITEKYEQYYASTYTTYHVIRVPYLVCISIVLKEVSRQSAEAACFHRLST